MNEFFSAGGPHGMLVYDGTSESIWPLTASVYVYDRESGPVWRSYRSLIAEASDRQVACSFLPTVTGVQGVAYSSGQIRTETGLDYFGARYMSSAQGRWTSPDWSANPEPVPYANLWDPQSLNLYGYVVNNPLAYVDLDGHSDGCTWNMQKAILTCPQPPVRDLRAEAIAQWYERMQREREQNKPKQDQPIYGPQGQGAQVLHAAGERASHDSQCVENALLPLGLFAEGETMWGLGQKTVVKSIQVRGATVETSEMALAAHESVLSAVPARLPTVVRNAGGKLATRWAPNLGSFAGRTLPAVARGAGFVGLAAGAISLNSCLGQ